jgi:hypothetical protein
MVAKAESFDSLSNNARGPAPSLSLNPGDIAPILDRLERIESALDILARERTIKDHYTTAELAAMLGKAEFTVREWARLGRITAQKKQHGRGAHAEWVVAREELLRYQREGLLPRR